MKIVVCIKQVPNVSELKFDPTTKTLIREGVPNEINPFDRRAITVASALKAKFGGESIVMTMGPPQAKEALLEALAMGADKGVHLLDRVFAGSDTLATSRALAAAIKQEMPVDLILCGKYSVDAETGHVGPELAELLALPHVSGATRVEMSDPPTNALVEAETDYGVQEIETSLPFLVTAAERLIEPYRPKPEEFEAARAKPYRVIQASQLGPPGLFGFEGSPTYVSEIRSIETSRKCVIIRDESVEEKALKLVNLLRGRGLFEVWGNEDDDSLRPQESRVVTGNRAIWVIAEKVQGQIRQVTYELLGKGLELATKLESELVALVFGLTSRDQLKNLIACGADRIYTLNHPALLQYSNDAYANALAQTIQKFEPYAVLAGSTSFGRDFMPRVAARLGLGMTSDCVGLDLNDSGQLVQLKPAFGGNIVAPIMSKTMPNIALIRPGIFSASQPNLTRNGEVVEVKLNDLKALSKVVKEQFRSDTDALKLDSADVIVAAGAGIGSPGKLAVINELARVLDAPVATTRKVVDLGWLPSQLQIGLTGRSVGPKLYVAVGIRGAFNHMVGVGRAKVVVAINNDENAPIFKNCDYGIVGDFAEVVPAVTEVLRNAKQQAAKG